MKPKKQPAPGKRAKAPRRQRGGADPDDLAATAEEFPQPEPMELGPALPRREKERIVTRVQQQQQQPPPVALRPGPAPRPDAPPPPSPPKVPEGVEIIRREMDALIREISEGVRRTAGDISDSERLTEINDRLVSFVTGVMEALSRMLENVEAYNTQMMELAKQLKLFSAQAGKGTAKTDRAANDAVKRLVEFKNMVQKSMEGMKKYLRAEDVVPLQQAVKNWDQLMQGASKAPPQQQT